MGVERWQYDRRKTEGLCPSLHAKRLSQILSVAVSINICVRHDKHTVVFFLVCVLYICVFVYMCPCVGGSQKTTSSAVTQVLLAWFLRQAHSFVWSLPLRLGCPICLPSTRTLKWLTPCLAFLCGFWGPNSSFHA